MNMSICRTLSVLPKRAIGTQVTLKPSDTSVTNSNKGKKMCNQTKTPVQPFDDIPGPKPLPLIGNIWRYLPIIGDYKLDTLYDNAQYNKKRYGTLVREKITSNHTVLHLFDPNDIESFFRQDGKYPHRRSHRALLKYRTDRPHQYSDGGLFPENGPKWYRQRNLFQHRLMSKSHVSSDISKLDSMSLKTIRWLEMQLVDSSDINNFEYIIYKWALANSFSVFLDIDIDSFDEKYIAKFIQILHNTLTSTEKTEIHSDKWIKQPNKCPHYKLLSESQEFLYDFVSKQISKTNDTKSSSYLNNWLNIDKIDQKDIITFVIDALMAGLHTTSYTIAFLLYQISNNQNVLNNLQNEIDVHILDYDKPITVDTIDKLILLKDCLKETFRLNPVSIGTGRVTTQDNLCLKNYSIPKDIMVISQNQTISRDESFYDKPETFDPTRWAKYRTLPRKERPTPFATLPFGFGARACIGQRLAELQIKIMTSRLLKKYTVTFNHKIPVQTTMIHNIAGPISIKLIKRI